MLGPHGTLRRGLWRPSGPRRGRRPNGWSILAYVAADRSGAVIMVFPFVWMLLSSFKDAREVLSPAFWPREFTLRELRRGADPHGVPALVPNSMIVAVLNTASVLFFCSLVGYVLATMRFPGKQFIFIAILSTLMVPTEMLVIPWFVMSAQFGWVDTYWGLLFPGLIPGFGVFLMRQFFQTLPRDLFDAGRIDGVSEFGLFLRIGLPLVGPGLAALGIFAFIGNWNAFLWPLIVASRPRCARCRSASPCSRARPAPPGT
jgi:multiple sugar transport system permease protein